jgi:hypothetical protein
MPEPRPIKRYTVTSALPYANGPKHIGHLAGAYIPADVYVRFLRLLQKNVVFVCGSDEHGTAIPNQALKEGTTSQAIIDKYHVLIRDCLHALGISFDIYHRTSEAIHHSTSQEMFLNLFNKGLLTEVTSEQYFDPKVQVFLADRYIMGTCPRCGNPNAYGDQCEKCGSTLSPSELINPRSTLSGAAPILKPTKHWYLPLQDYEPWLREWILKSHAADWKTNVYGQCKSWIDAGLQPRAMTRDLDWGIKVPLPDADGKVLYVWFDAPIGYISATRALFDEMSTGKLKYATPQSDFGKVPSHSQNTCLLNVWRGRSTSSATSACDSTATKSNRGPRSACACASPSSPTATAPYPKAPSRPSTPGTTTSSCAKQWPSNFATKTLSVPNVCSAPSPCNSAPRPSSSPRWRGSSASATAPAEDVCGIRARATAGDCSAPSLQGCTTSAPTWTKAPSKATVSSLPLSARTLS